MSQGCQAQPSQDVGPMCLLSEASCCPASSCPRNPGQVLSASSGLARGTRRGISEGAGGRPWSS